MNQTQHLKCDTSDCIHWKEGKCVKETQIAIREHQCIDYEEHIILPTATVTIEVSNGAVQNVYASPDLPTILVELIDIDTLQQESEEELAHGRRLLAETAQAHKLIF